MRVADPVKDKVKSRAEPPKFVLEVRYAGKSLFALNIYDDAQGTAQPADSCICPPLTRHASPGDDTGAVDTDVVLPPEALVDLAEVLGAGREGAAAEDVVDAALRPSDDPPPPDFVDEDAEAHAAGEAAAPDASAEATAPHAPETAAPPAAGTVKNPLFFTAVSRRKVRVARCTSVAQPLRAG